MPPTVSRARPAETGAWNVRAGAKAGDMAPETRGALGRLSIDFVEYGGGVRRLDVHTFATAFLPLPCGEWAGVRGQPREAMKKTSGLRLHALASTRPSPQSSPRRGEEVKASARQVDRVDGGAVAVVLELADAVEPVGMGHALLAAGGGEGHRAAGLQRGEAPRAGGQVVRAEVVVLSYNDEAWIRPEELVSWLRDAGHEDVQVLGYQHHPAIKAPVAV